MDRSLINGSLCIQAFLINLAWNSRTVFYLPWSSFSLTFLVSILAIMQLHSSSARRMTTATLLISMPVDTISRVWLDSSSCLMCLTDSSTSTKFLPSIVFSLILFSAITLELIYYFKCNQFNSYHHFHVNHVGPSISLCWCLLYATFPFMSSCIYMRIKFLIIACTMVLVAIPANSKGCQHSIFCNETILTKVAESNYFEDSKTFVDLVLTVPVEEALRQFSSETIDQFITNCFDQPDSILSPVQLKDWKQFPPSFSGIKDPGLRGFAKGLNSIWQQLARKVVLDFSNGCSQNCSSFLPEMDGRTVLIPGGRFRQSYYWDTYWIIKGLIACDMLDSAETLLNNFILMVQIYGFIPNGFRQYFLNRSQPPFFGLMVKSLSEAYHKKGQSSMADALEERSFHALNVEHEYFMATHSRKIRLAEGRNIILNCYNADTNSERPESFREDHNLVANISKMEKERVLKGISTMAESGWDFSSRWLENWEDLRTNRITEMVPSDLNTLMAKTQQFMVELSAKFKRQDLSEYYHGLLMDRKEYFASIFNGVSFPDQIVQKDSLTARSSTYPSDFYPFLLFPSKAVKLGNLYSEVVNPSSSLADTRQQWDSPNVWAPNNWILHEVLGPDEALRFAREWVSTTYCSWLREGILYEKYDSSKLGKRGEGGEYKVQAGFGWTNGLALYYLVSYGDKIVAPQC